MGNCEELGAGTHPTHSTSKCLPSCWKCFNVLLVIKLQKLVSNLLWFLIQPKAGPCFVHSGCIPTLLHLFHILPGNSSPLHWTPWHFLRKGQCCDHNYLQLIMLSYRKASVPKIPIDIHQYYSDKTLISLILHTIPSWRWGERAFSSRLTFSGTLEVAGHYILPWSLLHTGSHGKYLFACLHPAPLQEAHERC